MIEGIKAYDLSCEYEYLIERLDHQGNVLLMVESDHRIKKHRIDKYRVKDDKSSIPFTIIAPTVLFERGP